MSVVMTTTRHVAITGFFTPLHSLDSSFFFSYFLFYGLTQRQLIAWFIQLSNYHFASPVCDHSAVPASDLHLLPLHPETSPRFHLIHAALL